MLSNDQIKSALSGEAILRVLSRDSAPSAPSNIAGEANRPTKNIGRELTALRDAGLIDVENAITDQGREAVAALARLADPEAAAPPPGAFALLQHHQLVPDPNQPRRRFSDAELESLARSIGQEGVLQTLLVRPAAPLPFDHPAYPGEGHMIIAGERRWRAIGRIIAAGEWPDGEGIPCRIATPEDEADALEKAMAENLVREELNHMEIGLGFEALAQAGRSNREIADRLGRSIEFVQQHRQITRLKPGEQRWVAEGMMTFHDALKVVRGQATAVLPVSASQVVLYPVNAKPAEPEPEQPVLGGMEAATSRTAPPPKEDLGDGVWRDVAPEEVGGGETVPSGDMPVLSRRARLALVEIAHKGEAAGATTPGDAQVGEYWKDKTADELAKAGLIAIQHLTAGPVARLTARGDEWLQDAGIERPVTLIVLYAEQEAGRPLMGSGRLYGTDWLEFGVEPAADAPKTATFGQVYDPRTDAMAQAEADAPVRPASEAIRDAIADDWDRTPEQIAADQQVLQDVRAFIAGEGGGVAVRDLFARAGVDLQRGGLTGGADGAIVAYRALDGAEAHDFGEGYELATVDVNQEVPTERVEAIAALIAWCVNICTGALPEAAS